LKALLGDYPVTKHFKQHSSLEFADVKVPNTAFKRVVRDLEFDVAELAIVTYLMAKAHGKPLVLLPAALLGRAQHASAVYNVERGQLTPKDLNGKRVGIRSFTTTTGAWVRGILANDYGVDLSSIKWVSFEDPHVAEYKDTTERAPAGKNILQMLIDGEIDAALGETSTDPRLKPLFGDPVAEADRWHKQRGLLPVNHLVVVTEALAKSRPDAVREVYRMLKESKAKAGASTPDFVPIGVEGNRKALALIIDYAHQQGLIPRRYSVDELFDDTTRTLN
jgi:4,5-dihydroxyphthalate decarboxylase